MKSLLEPDASTGLSGANAAERRGGFVEIDGDRYYRIADYHRLEPFFISLVSGSNHWFYISTNGGCTMGRVEADQALLPYETVDKIHRNPNGAISALRVGRPGTEPVLWQPFRRDLPPALVERNLYKSCVGDRLIFEESHRLLGLTFRTRWATSNRFGFVRKAELVNHGDTPVTCELFDGLRNILPAGVSAAMHNRVSCLVHAYQWTERMDPAPLVAYSLASAINDNPIPIESLLSNVVWAEVPDDGLVIDLSDSAWESFLRDEPGSCARVVRGEPAGFFLRGPMTVEPGATRSWTIIADTHYSQVEVARLRQELLEHTPGLELQGDLAESRQQLLLRVASADGQQCSRDEMASTHHFTNVLFNIMRGGVPAHENRISKSDFLRFCREANRTLAGEVEAAWSDLPDSVTRTRIADHFSSLGDSQIARLFLEYLPLTFGRRHGDPSRPWNRFTIEIEDEEGNPRLNYQGNWRDIFQNWEALALSFPEFLPHMIARFLNATTAEGFNPYRVLRNGCDYEVPVPDDPWASIGFWGDHQIIYLLKLLEWSRAIDPDCLSSWSGRPLFSHNRVPYRMKSHPDCVANPRETLDFDEEQHREIQDQIAALGSDGMLLPGSDGAPRLVTLEEKLLIPVLCKCSQFVPGGGLWLNTQRPEWNDANNALAGFGLSIVTLAYLRRHIHFLESLLESGLQDDSPVSQPVLDWMESIGATLEKEAARDFEALSDPSARRRCLDRLAEAGDTYRQAVRSVGTPPTGPLNRESLKGFFRILLQWIDRTLDCNRREDGLFHSYNLVIFGPGTAEIEFLPEMLEGQMAVLSSSFLSPEQSVELLDRLEQSALYRDDLETYLLYPDRTLGSLFERNRILPGMEESFPGLRTVLALPGQKILEKDEVSGCLRFHPECINRAALEARIRPFSEKLTDLKPRLFDAYEAVFHHHAFTGRSGRMFGFEGLGCTYWHMNAKLLLACQESWLRALKTKAPAETVRRLKQHYETLRNGLGYKKSPEVYGAFPMDPYSHTPSRGGAKQPGMTGLVKEEILTRWTECGLEFCDGCLEFHPGWIDSGEFHREEVRWPFIDRNGETVAFDLPAGSLGISIAGLPVILQKKNSTPGIRLIRSDGTEVRVSGYRLARDQTRSIFRRDGEWACLRVDLPTGTAG